MTSLQEQLMKAGLADAKKAKAIKQEKRKQAKQTPKGQTREDETKLAAQQALAEKSARDREINRQQQEKAERKAINAQIKQLIEVNLIDRDNGEVAYQFSHGKKIKKIYVTEKLQQQLIRGLIAVVTLGDGYALVPAVVADKIAQRDDSRVIVKNDPAADVVDEDDPYADYQIPDDLMW
jgi:hypothetical protein